MKFLWNVTPEPRLSDEAWPTTNRIMRAVAHNRGLESERQLVNFLNPSMAQMLNPMTMFGMRRAAERICEAIKAKEKIVVYGDYDVDGITGTTTMMLGLKLFGADVHFHIPHRVHEGYGLNVDSLNTLIDEGAKLIISVDCGVTGFDPAAAVKARGIDLIITDHHEFKHEEDGTTPKLPDCYQVVHPAIGDTYLNPFLCGSGVAFKVAWAVGMMMNDGFKVAPENKNFYAEAIAFTALGTIADVVKLVNENRVIATCGLNRIKRTCFPGLKGFLASANLEGEDVDGYKVGFTLAPRLNAAGRMGHASTAVHLLTQENYVEAQKIGAGLEGQNILRQETEKQIVEQANKYVEALMAGDRPSEVLLVPGNSEHNVFVSPPSDVLMVLGKGWHPGVIGIVASRICEKYHRPTLVLIMGSECCHGSGRSVEGFNLTAAIASCAHLVKNYGGHAMACGLRIENHNVEAFRNAICAYAREHQTVEMKRPEIKIECEATIPEMTEELCHQLTSVGPFGPGNRRPFFLLKNLTVHNPRRIGKNGQYLMFHVNDGKNAMKAVWFKPTEEAFSLIDGERVDIVAEPATNEYPVGSGKVSVQLMLRDVELSVKTAERNIFTP